MLNRLFGALAVAVGIGAVVAVKLLKNQKETENKEEDDDNEVRFITLSDGDGVAQPSYDVSDRSVEVQEVCGVYPYLNPDFVEELLAEAKRRLSLLRGTEYDYPRQHVNSTDKYRATVPAYQYHIYGEKEGGGTQVLRLKWCTFC